MTLTFGEPVVATLAERVGAFLPLALFLRWELERRQARRPALRAFAAVVGLALGIELAQAIVSARHALLTDFLIASGMAGVGVLLPTVVSYLQRNPQRALRAGAVAVNLVLLSVVLAAHWGAGLRDWDCSYPLLVGNESSGDRPWRGEIRGLAIYPRALDAAEVRRLSAVPLLAAYTTPRRKAGASVVYDFSDLASGHASQTHGTIGAVLNVPTRLRPPPDNLENRTYTALRATRSPHEVCQAIEESQSFSVEVVMRSADPVQEGPARIVSMSRGTGLRNFTLGEREGALVLRVRTPRNGPNGSLIEHQTPPGSLSSGWHHVVASYEDGTARIWIDGVEAGSALQAYRLLHLGVGTVSVAAIVGILVVLAASLGGLVFKESRPLPRLLKVYLVSAALPLTLAAVSSHWLLQPPSLGYLGASFLGPLLGMALVANRPWRARRPGAEAGY
jgi:hypothetical protein